MATTHGRDGEVLVAYATAHGCTRGVAERIGAVLADHGRRAVVAEAGAIDDVNVFDAVVLGSPVYDGSWLPAATEFVARHAEELARMPVWLFSVGAFGDGHRGFGRMMRREPRNIAALRDAVRARGYRVFAGEMSRDRWPLRGRVVFRVLGGRYGDNRDWPAIDDWAAGIGRELGTGGAVR